MTPTTAGLAGQVRASEPTGTGTPPFAWLALLLAAAFLLRIFLWWLLPNIHHPDEIFQYLEPAHRQVFGYGIVPWEYRIGNRSWLVPGLLSGILQAADFVGLSAPRQYGFLVAATLSLLSLSIVVVGYLWGYRRGGLTAAIITGALCAFWFEIVYFAPKTLTEPIAAAVLVVALYVACPGEPTRSRQRLFIAGLLFGLIVAVRINLAPAILVAAVFLCRGDVRQRWLPLVTGGAVTVGLAGLLDTLTWDYPFQAIITNVWVNVVENKSHQFGVAPWYFFIGKLTLIWGGALVPIGAFFLLGARRNPLPALVAVAIVLTHLLFAHKEYRFIFPAIPLVMMLVGLGTAAFLRGLRSHLPTPRLQLAAAGFAVGAWTLTSAVLAIGDHFRHYWTDGGVNLALFEQARRAPDLCGLGLIRVYWWKTGGYSYLHRDVPIIIPPDGSAAAQPAYNYAIAPRGVFPAGGPYADIDCHQRNGVCLYHRAGTCDVDSSWELNAMLRRTGQ